jgi:hypothetical protein
MLEEMRNHVASLSAGHLNTFPLKFLQWSDECTCIWLRLNMDGCEHFFVKQRICSVVGRHMHRYLFGLKCHVIVGFNSNSDKVVHRLNCKQI